MKEMTIEDQVHTNRWWSIENRVYTEIDVKDSKGIFTVAVCPSESFGKYVVALIVEHHNVALGFGEKYGE